MPKVFISSTSQDLTEYREAAINACNRLQLIPVAMEFFEAMGKGASAGSIHKVDECDVYLGFFAHRYGFIEEGYTLSVTEMEFEHAQKRGLECLCLVMHDDHPWPVSRIEFQRFGELTKFKDRVKKQIVAFFTTVDDFKTKVYQALDAWVKKSAVPAPSTPSVLVPRQLPAPPRDFVGRETVLRELQENFENGVAISGIRGQGGIGKTALALKLGELLVDQFPDGQIYIDLKGVDADPLPPREVMAHILRSFQGIDFRVPEDDALRESLYRSTLGGKRVLLLLDNAANEAQVEPLLAPRDCAAIITSRRHFTVPGFSCRDLEALTAVSAIDLLRSIAPRMSESDAAKIAERCGYLPQALRLAGSALNNRKDLSPTRYLEQLSKRRLETLDEVAKAIRVSELLLPKEVRSKKGKRLKWHCLAVFVGGFEAEAAAEVWGVDVETTDRYLGILIRNSLLDWIAEKEWYQFHDLVREYAECGLSNELRREAQLRHAKSYARQLIAAEDLYDKGGNDLDESLRRFDRIWNNARAAFNWVGDQVHTQEIAEICKDFGIRTVNILYLRQDYRERILWLQTALEAARFLQNKPGEGSVLGNLGLTYHSLGEYRKAIKCHAQLLTIAREIGDKQNEGRSLGNLGIAYQAMGEFRKAIEFQEKRLKIVKQIGDKRGESIALGNLGHSYSSLGENQKAIDYLEQKLKIAKQIGDKRGEGESLGGLGVAYHSLGENRKAIEFFEQTLKIAKQIGDKRGEGRSLGDLGVVYHSLGENRKAIEFLQQFLAIARKIGDRQGEGISLGNLGIAYDSLGEYDRAIEFYEQDLIVAREIGDKRGEAFSQWNLGLSLEKLGKIAQAIPCFELRVSWEREIGHADAEKHAEKVEKMRKQLAEKEGQGEAG